MSAQDETPAHVGDGEKVAPPKWIELLPLPSPNPLDLNPTTFPLGSDREMFALYSPFDGFWQTVMASSGQSGSLQGPTPERVEGGGEELDTGPGRKGARARSMEVGSMGSLCCV